MKWLAFVIGVLAAGVAMAQDVAPDATELAGLVKVSAPLWIVALVRALRGWVPAMADGSHFAKAATFGACLVLGIVLALLGAAPAMDAAYPLAGRVLGGIGAGAIAFGLAAVAGSKARGETNAEAP